jgi:hypothetical protein
VNAAFGTFFGALIGFVLLPWSTLMYLTVYPGGIFGFEPTWPATSAVTRTRAVFLMVTRFRKVLVERPLTPVSVAGAHHRGHRRTGAAALVY